MALLNFWRSDRDSVLRMSVTQTLAIAGDGDLCDDSDCSHEFREFLSLLPSERLADYAQHCLESGFSKSGFVLQDVVNEIGRRLEFDVERGAYRGRRNAVGFDGIWRYRTQAELIVEVKTTDTYNFSLDTLSSYRNKLISEGRAKADTTILIVVGREDTGAFEAQIRGSRYAWDIRLISVDGLLRALQVAEKSEESRTWNQIRQVLRPFEYTKVDRIIDLIFETAMDVENQAEQESAAELGSTNHPSGVTSSAVAVEEKRHEVVSSFAADKGIELIKRSRAFFWTADRKLRVCCAVSKRYSAGHRPYWYAYPPEWDRFLDEADEAYVILGCM